jgi:AcrR family transcriptional regulator
MPTARKSTRQAAAGKPETPYLGRDNWLDAAFDAVVEGGFDKVRVLVLADTLGVTRGSFYWHFSDHAELLAALLARWWQREIDEDLALRAQATADPQLDLLALLDQALSRHNDGLRRVRFELALRGLGRRDSAVAQMLAKVDAARLALFEAKFLRLTQDAQVATELATLFYLTISGSFQALARPASPAAAARVAGFIRGVIAHHLIARQAVSPALDPPAR